MREINICNHDRKVFEEASIQVMYCLSIEILQLCNTEVIGYCYSGPWQGAASHYLPLYIPKVLTRVELIKYSAEQFCALWQFKF